KPGLHVRRDVVPRGMKVLQALGRFELLWMLLLLPEPIRFMTPLGIVITSVVRPFQQAADPRGRLSSDSAGAKLGPHAWVRLKLVKAVLAKGAPRGVPEHADVPGACLCLLQRLGRVESCVLHGPHLRLITYGPVCRNFSTFSCQMRTQRGVFI